MVQIRNRYRNFSKVGTEIIKNGTFKCRNSFLYSILLELDPGLVYSVLLRQDLDQQRPDPQSRRAIPRRTNLASNTAFRGFGGPEGTLIVEDIIERIAHKLSMDPMEVRRANITRAGDLLHHGSSTVPDDNILRCFEECLAMSNYAEERKAIVAFNADPRNAHVRRGIAILPTKFAPCVPFPLFNQGSAFVRIYKDGTVLLSHGGIEMGQGLHTKMLQVGVSYEGLFSAAGRDFPSRIRSLDFSLITCYFSLERHKFLYRQVKVNISVADPDP